MLKIEITYNGESECRVTWTVLQGWHGSGGLGKLSTMKPEPFWIILIHSIGMWWVFFWKYSIIKVIKNFTGGEGWLIVSCNWQSCHLNHWCPIWALARGCSVYDWAPCWWRRKSSRGWSTHICHYHLCGKRGWSPWLGPGWARTLVSTWAGKQKFLQLEVSLILTFK